MSRESRALGCKPKHHWMRVGGCGITLAMMLGLGWLAAAQTTDTSAIDAYLKAVRQSDISSRLAAFERFAASDANSSLRVDALEWIVWGEKQTHNDAAAANWARRLSQVDPANALALAVTADAERQQGQPSTVYLPMAKIGASSLGRLRRPEGMSHVEFMQLQRQAEAMLNAAIGYGELDRKDYAGARATLAKAVEASPNDAQLVYALALADLSGDRPNRQQGYWLLAKAVNLAGASARQIEEFGRKRYRDDGGSDRDWEQFLAATAGPAANAATMIAAAPAPETPGHRPETHSIRARKTKSVASKEKPKEGAKKRERDALAEIGLGKEPKASKETMAANSLPPISEDKRVARAGAAVSLGILIETSMARKDTRKAIVYSLSDLVRHLGRNDEAFILSFSHDLVFEQDLTGDASRLEQAMDQIKPHTGTALLDAVGFASGHLQRIASNQNRVLLVIADGRNGDSRIPAPATSSEIRASGVKIYCIGVDVSGHDSRSRLEALASGTGGIASFINAPEQFRGATEQVAMKIGIPFQF